MLYQKFRKAARRLHDYGFFLMRWFKNPRKVGAITPSSRALAGLMARSIRVDCSEAMILELGAGTGGLTDGLLAAGVKVRNLCIVEIDAKLCKLLRKKYPEALVIEGDVRYLAQLLPVELHHKIDAIISGIPALNFSLKSKKAMMQSSFTVLKPGGEFLQFTYGPKSPWPAAKLGIHAQRVGKTIRNIPPATIWRYTRTEDAGVSTPLDAAHSV